MVVGIEEGGIMKSSTACIGGGRGGEVKTTLYALRGDQVSAQLSQEKSSRSPHPQARNNDRSLRGS